MFLWCCSESDDQTAAYDADENDREYTDASNEASDREMESEDDSANESNDDEDNDEDDDEDEECHGEVDDLLDEALTDEVSTYDEKEVVAQSSEPAESTVFFAVSSGILFLVLLNSCNILGLISIYFYICGL